MVLGSTDPHCDAPATKSVSGKRSGLTSRRRGGEWLNGVRLESREGQEGGRVGARTRAGVKERQEIRRDGNEIQGELATVWHGGTRSQWVNSRYSPT